VATHGSHRRPADFGRGGAGRTVGGLIADRNFALVLASPLRRAQQTAELAGLRTSRLTPTLSSGTTAAYEGLTTAQIRVILPGWSLWRDGVPAHAEANLARVRRTSAGPIASSARIAGARSGRRGARLARPFPARTRHPLAVVSANGRAMLALDTGSASVLGFEHGAHVLRHWNLLPS